MRRTTKAGLTRWVEALETRAEEGRLRREDGRIDRVGRLSVTRNSVTVDTFAQVANAQVTEQGLIVRLAVPGWGGLSILHHLERELRRRGIPYYTASRRAMNASSLDKRTIEVIDSTKRATKWDLPQSLIKARVTTYDQSRWWESSGKRAAEQSSREVYFLCGFDSQELVPVFFMCELPRWARPRSVAEAYDSLKPSVVRDAELFGRKVKRQGDIFMVPVKTAPPTGEIQMKEYLLGTNHLATEVVHDGNLTYARGVMKHRPRGRRPDHRSVRIGSRWHLIVKNTVPVIGR